MAACIHDCSSKTSTNLFSFETNQSQITGSSPYCRFVKLSASKALSKPCVNWVGEKISHTFEDHHEHDEDEMWLKIQGEAEFDAQQEPILRDHYFTSISSHDSLESALANLLAMKLSNSSLSKSALSEVFLSVFSEDHQIRKAVRKDLKAVKERDPACTTHVHCFLYFKGFQACQAHRVAHKLWSQKRTALAALIQSRVSEVFGVDIHPGAKIGSGLVIDHATGVVIGETTIVGDNVTILHNVTLGGTGKVSGDRHPKIGDGVFIGAGSKVLGSIRIGEGARIGAGSVVLKQVPANTTVVGNPARLISK